MEEGPILLKKDPPIRREGQNEFPAAFEGFCYAGKDRIEIGDLICRGSDGGFHHSECFPSTNITVG